MKVKVSGARVRYHNGYYAPRDFQHLEKESRDRQLADALNSENPEVDLPIAVETSVFRLNDEQAYVPISTKLSPRALDWAQKHDRREAAFDFAVEVRAVPSGQSVAALRDTISVRLDQQRFAEVNRSSLVYQGGVVLVPRNYRLKLVARENESGKISTFEENLTVSARPPARVSLSSVLLSSQLVPVEKSTEAETKGRGFRAELATTPLEIAGERIVPSVTRFFQPAANALRFLPGLLSREAGKESGLLSEHLARRPDIFSRRSAGEYDSADRAYSDRRENAHRIVPNQLAARQASNGALHGASGGYRRWDAAVRIRPRLPSPRTAAASTHFRGSRFTRATKADKSLGSALHAVLCG